MGDDNFFLGVCVCVLGDRQSSGEKKKSLSVVSKCFGEVKAFPKGVKERNLCMLCPKGFGEVKPVPKDVKERNLCML